MVFKKQTIVDYTTTDKQKATAAQKTLIAIYEGDNAFDITLVKALESYLDEQLTSSTNDVDANLALLKMYLVYPETTNVQKIAQVLTKCVMLFPSSAFNGASAIIPETFREDTNVKLVLQAGLLLQSCRFEEFWKVDLTFLNKVAGFTDAVRAYILDTLRMSHSVLASSVLKSSLNMNDKEVNKVIQEEKWTVDPKGLIRITPSEENQMRPQKVQENIELDDVLKVIHTLSR